ncbi:MAG: hypothetical protein RL518_1658 [Pseudomonadota bacterium]|jgi:hypothetical protein
MFALVLIAAGTLGICGWYFFVRDPVRARAYAQSRWFQEKLGDFRNHIVTLDRHSNEYCAVFSDNEWSKLKETLIRLEQVDDDVRHHLSQCDYPQALSILERVNSPIHENSPLAEVDQEIQHVQELMNWQRTVHGMLKKVVFNLEVAATTTNDLSKPRLMNNPRPTLVTLADIKKVLLEDEELHKMSRQ